MFHMTIKAYLSIIDDINSQSDWHQRKDHAHEDGADNVANVELLLLLRLLERMREYLYRMEALQGF